MRWAVVLASVIVAGVSVGCASPSVRSFSGSEQRAVPEDMATQRRAVEVAIAATEREYTEGLAVLEQRGDDDSTDADLGRLLAERHAAREQALRPLVARGNGEAMYRLAADLRDSADPGEVARWFELISSAARTGHPVAHDELVRWWWHQKGDGSIGAVQRYRARALEHAEAAADSGYLRSLNRIAVYIAGDVHQYPASLPLARELMRLCAQGGYQECQERLALRSSYEFAENQDERYFWLSVLARRRHELVGARMAAMQVSMSAEHAVLLQERAGAWRPATWAELRPQWRRLREAVLAHGASSVGVYGACSTSTPWCRGDVTKLDQEPDT